VPTVWVDNSGLIVASLTNTIGWEARFDGAEVSAFFLYQKSASMAADKNPVAMQRFFYYNREKSPGGEFFGKAF